MINYVRFHKGSIIVVLKVVLNRLLYDLCDLRLCSHAAKIIFLMMSHFIWNSAFWKDSTVGFKERYIAQLLSRSNVGVKEFHPTAHFFCFTSLKNNLRCSTRWNDLISVFGIVWWRCLQEEEASRTLLNITATQYITLTLPYSWLYM